MSSLWTLIGCLALILLGVASYLNPMAVLLGALGWCLISFALWWEWFTSPDRGSVILKYLDDWEIGDD